VAGRETVGAGVLVQSEGAGGALLEPDGCAVNVAEAAGDHGDGCKAMRADARRNYERLVSAARDVFAKFGADASMEAVAKEAGVGVGTLYRHFPRRIDLVEAVYRTDVDQLVFGADAAIQELEPWPALVKFLQSFVGYAMAKRVLLTELHEAFEKNPELKVASRDRINRAMNQVLAGAQRAGEVRTDIDGNDLMQLISPMCTSCTVSEEQSRRLITMVLDGLRQPTATTGPAGPA